MKVEKELHKIWKKEIDASDCKKIEADYNISARTIERAKATGKCHPKTRNAIITYLTKKRFEMKEFLKEFKLD